LTKLAANRRAVYVASGSARSSFRFVSARFPARIARHLPRPKRCSLDIPHPCLFRLFFTAPAFAQVGPIEPVIVTSSKPSKTLADIPSCARTTSFRSSHGRRRWHGEGRGCQPVERQRRSRRHRNQFHEGKEIPAGPRCAGAAGGSARAGSVEVQSKTRNKQLKANMKAPNTQNEVARVRKLTCKDFLWEINRLRGEGASPTEPRDHAVGVLARLHARQEHPEGRGAEVSAEMPKALAEAEQSCKATPDKFYLKDVLMMTLDSLAPNN